MSRLVPYLLVGVGGFLGANTRFIVGKFLVTENNAFPLGTFIVNITGCFFLGLLGYAVFHVKGVNPEYLRYTLGVGFLGAYTTFSTFEFETMVLMDQRAFAIATLYVAASVLIGFIAVRLGMVSGSYLGRFF